MKIEFSGKADCHHSIRRLGWFCLLLVVTGCSPAEPVGQHGGANTLPPGASSADTTRIDPAEAEHQASDVDFICLIEACPGLIQPDPASVLTLICSDGTVIYRNPIEDVDRLPDYSVWRLPAARRTQLLADLRKIDQDREAVLYAPEEPFSWDGPGYAMVWSLDGNTKAILMEVSLPGYFMTETAIEEGRKTFWDETPIEDFMPEYDWVNAHLPKPAIDALRELHDFRSKQSQPWAPEKIRVMFRPVEDEAPLYRWDEVFPEEPRLEPPGPADHWSDVELVGSVDAKHLERIAELARHNIVLSVDGKPFKIYWRYIFPYEEKCTLYDKEIE